MPSSAAENKTEPASDAARRAQFAEYQKNRGSQRAQNAVTGWNENLIRVNFGNKNKPSVQAPPPQSGDGKEIPATIESVSASGNAPVSKGGDGNLHLKLKVEIPHPEKDAAWQQKLRQLEAEQANQALNFEQWNAARNAYEGALLQEALGEEASAEQTPPSISVPAASKRRTALNVLQGGVAAAAKQAEAQRGEDENSSENEQPTDEDGQEELNGLEILGAGESQPNNRAAQNNSTVPPTAETPPEMPPAESDTPPPGASGTPTNEPPTAGENAANDLARQQALDRGNQAPTEAGDQRLTPPDQADPHGKNGEQGSPNAENGEQENEEDKPVGGIKGAINEAAAPAMQLLNARKIKQVEKKIEDEDKKIREVKKRLDPLEKELSTLKWRKRYMRRRDAIDRIKLLWKTTWELVETVIVPIIAIFLTVYWLAMGVRGPRSIALEAEIKTKEAAIKKIQDELKKEFKIRKNLFKEKAELEKIFKQPTQSTTPPTTT